MYPPTSPYLPYLSLLEPDNPCVSLCIPTPSLFCLSAFFLCLSAIYLKVIVVGKGNFLYCEALQFAGGKVSLEKEGRVFEGKTSNDEELPDGIQCVRFRSKNCNLAFRNAEDNEGFYDIDMRDTAKHEAKKVFKFALQHRKYWKQGQNITVSLFPYFLIILALDFFAYTALVRRHLVDRHVREALLQRCRQFSIRV